MTSRSLSAAIMGAWAGVVELAYLTQEAGHDVKVHEWPLHIPTEDSEGNKTVTKTLIKTIVVNGVPL